MTQDEVSKHAQRFKGLRLESSAAENHLVALKGNTVIQLWFADTGLNAQQVTWSYPVTRYSSRLKMDLCTGERVVVVQIVAPPAFEGATVMLDGAEVDQLSAQGTTSLELGLGRHQLTIEKAPFGRKERELVYDADSPGHDRLVFGEDSAEHP